MRRSRDVPSLTIELLESRQLFSATPSLGLAGGAELLSSASNGNVKLPYSYYVAGNAGDIPANLTPQSSGLALMGGGLDVDEVFKWMYINVLYILLSCFCASMFIIFILNYLTKYFEMQSN